MRTLSELIYLASRDLGALWVTRRLSRNHPRILMYHRVNPDQKLQGVPPHSFRKQMEEVKKSFCPISLNNLLSRSKAGHIPNNCVSITFDDGYADFYEYAFPILRELEIPVTLFITTGFINRELWLWPDKLKYLIQNAPPNTKLELPNQSAILNLEENPEQAWNAIGDYCLEINNDEKITFLESLFEKLDVRPPNEPPPEYRACSWQQINQMISEGLDIGSHSHTHPILTKLGETELNTEIYLSKVLIEKKLGVSDVGFCIPNGQVFDFNDREKSSIRMSGYKYAVAAYASPDPLKDIWSINRYPVNKDAIDFMKVLYGFRYLKMKLQSFDSLIHHAKF